MPTIEHGGLGLRFELPDFRQRDVEDFFAAVRQIQNGIQGTTPEILEGAAVGFLAALQKNKVKLADADHMAVALREYLGALREMQDRAGAISSPEFVGGIVRAAARCGWLEGIAEDGVPDLPPNAVTWLSEAIQREVAQSYEVPPE
jgi:hypothetical protein